MRFIVVEHFSEGFFRKKAGRVFHYDKAMSSKGHQTHKTVKRPKVSVTKSRELYIGGRRYIVKSRKMEMTGTAGVGTGVQMALGAIPDTRRRKRFPRQKMPGVAR